MAGRIVVRYVIVIHPPHEVDLLKNCIATGCERAFWISSGAVVTDCRGVAQFGPLLFTGISRRYSLDGGRQARESEIVKICAAQIKPVAGDIPANLARHLAEVERAVAARVDLIVFPELSLTGYEPTLAAKLAAAPDDARLDVLQAISNGTGIAIGAGMPTKHDDEVRISLLIFRPYRQRHVYSKTFLHPDEMPFFAPGRSSPEIEIAGEKLALAICYETSVPEHWQSCLAIRPAAYVASVAKSLFSILGSHKRLADIAKSGSIPALMANCVGPADGGTCVGQSAAWDHHGSRLHALGDSEEGLLVFDTKSLATSVLR